MAFLGSASYLGASSSRNSPLTKITSEIALQSFTVQLAPACQFAPSRNREQADHPGAGSFAGAYACGGIFDHYTITRGNPSKAAPFKYGSGWGLPF